MGDLMRQRRQILAAAPHLVTDSGASLVANFAVPKVELLKVAFLPMYQGSGTPSPSNPIPLAGHASIRVSIGTEVKSISLGATYMGGTVDLVSGELTVTQKILILGSSASWAAVGSKFYCPLSDTSFAYIKTEQICNMYPYAELIITGSAAVTQDKHWYLQYATGYNRVWVYDTSYTLSTFKTLLGTTPLQVTYPITPQSYQLTPQAIDAIRGNQRVLSPDGEIDITYWTV